MLLLDCIFVYRVVKYSGRREKQYEYIAKLLSGGEKTGGNLQL